MYCLEDPNAYIQGTNQSKSSQIATSSLTFQILKCKFDSSATCA